MSFNLPAQQWVINDSVSFTTKVQDDCEMGAPILKLLGKIKVTFYKSLLRKLKIFHITKADSWVNWEEERFTPMGTKYALANKCVT